MMHQLVIFPTRKHLISQRSLQEKNTRISNRSPSTRSCKTALSRTLGSRYIRICYCYNKYMFSLLSLNLQLVSRGCARTCVFVCVCVCVCESGRGHTFFRRGRKADSLSPLSRTFCSPWVGNSQLPISICPAPIGGAVGCVACRLAVSPSITRSLSPTGQSLGKGGSWLY